MQQEDTNQQTASPHATAKPAKGSKKWWIAAAVVLIVIAVVTGIVWAVKITEDNGSKETADVANVEIQLREGFSPGTIRIKEGQTVVFTNNDTTAHGIAAIGEAPDGFGIDEQLNNGESYSYTFETAGTYTYNDPENPLSSNGVIIVEG